MGSVVLAPGCPVLLGARVPSAWCVPLAWRAGGPVSMVTRSHFPSPGCSRRLLGGGDSCCSAPMGDTRGRAPLPLGGPCSSLPAIWGGHHPPRPTLAVLSCRRGGCGASSSPQHGDNRRDAQCPLSRHGRDPGSAAGEGTRCREPPWDQGLVPRVTPVPRCAQCPRGKPGRRAGHGHTGVTASPPQAAGTARRLFILFMSGPPVTASHHSSVPGDKFFAFPTSRGLTPTCPQHPGPPRGAQTPPRRGSPGTLTPQNAGVLAPERPIWRGRQRGAGGAGVGAGGAPGPGALRDRRDGLMEPIPLIDSISAVAAAGRGAINSIQGTGNLIWSGRAIN